MTKENQNIKHSEEYANEFDRKRGLALGMGLAVENNLEFFIYQYFIHPQNSKTFFFDEVIVQTLSFAKKIEIFKRICEREEFEKKKVNKIARLIDKIRKTRNRIAHSESWGEPSKEKIFLVKRGETINKKDYLELNDEFMDNFDKDRIKAIEGINEFYLRFSKEGTIDERGTKNIL